MPSQIMETGRFTEIASNLCMNRLRAEHVLEACPGLLKRQFFFIWVADPEPFFKRIWFRIGRICSLEEWTPL